MKTLIKVTDGTAAYYSLAMLKRDNPNVSFPQSPSPELLAEYGVHDALVADAAPTRFHSESGLKLTFDNGEAHLTREWVAPPIADVQARAIDILSQRRRAKIERGFVFGGANVPCDAESQRSYTAAYVLANDFPDTVRKWKMPNGFIELDAATIKALAKAAADYVQACFDEQAEKVSLVEAAVTVEGVEAVLDSE